MKKKIITISSLILGLVLCIFGVKYSMEAYSEYQEYLHSEIEVEYKYVAPEGAMYRKEFYDLSDADKFHATVVSDSTCAIVGKFKSFRIEGDRLGKWNFDVKTVVYGDMPKNNIDVTAIMWQSELFTEDVFKKGEEYLLFLIEDDTIFYNEPQYGFSAEILIPINNLKTSQWNTGKIVYSENTNSVNIAEHYRKLANEKGYSKDKYIPTVIRNQDLKTCVEKSDVVIRFKVLYKMFDANLWPASTYKVETIECLKGIEYTFQESTQCEVRVYKDSLNIGEEYILTCSIINPNRISSYLLQSALNGIIPIEDKETVAQVYEWLGLKEPVTE